MPIVEDLGVPVEPDIYAPGSTSILLQLDVKSRRVQWEQMGWIRTGDREVTFEVRLYTGGGTSVQIVRWVLPFLEDETPFIFYNKSKPKESGYTLRFLVTPEERIP